MVMIALRKGLATDRAFGWRGRLVDWAIVVGHFQAFFGFWVGFGGGLSIGPRVVALAGLVLVDFMGFLHYETAVMLVPATRQTDPL